MDVHSPFYKNTAKLLVVVMALNPIAAAAADLAVDASAGGNTAITHAGNGVPVVNIATPTGKGLSHNKFLDYNVNQEGLILNNATAKLQSTQLGGYILGNGNLNGQAARVILNEITGSNTSLLVGYTEVAGQAAHTIVANPHGISCDGCGFINTPRVTLSTGKPLVAQGQLEGYDVEQGAIAIEGQGLNARNVDQFELITRSAQINAALHAKQLNITTGRNQVDAATLATEAKPQDGSAQPQLAIDSAALGGMYADTIHLVGTEQGVGVKLAGDMAASAGDIHIDANGELSLARTASSGDTTIKAQQVVLTNSSQAGGRVQISATGASGSVQLAPGKRLASRADMQIDASRIDNQGTLQAGMQANGDANPPATMRLAGGELINRGTLHALGSLSTQLNALDNSDGTLISSGTAHIAAHYLLNQRGSLLAHDALSLQTQHTDNRAGLLASDRTIDLFASQQLHNGHDGLVLSAAGGLNIEAGHLLNQGGTLQSNNGQLNLSTTGTLDNSAGQILSANAAISLTAADLFNLNGQLQAEGGSITATAQHFFNQQGRVQADSLSLTSQHSLNNSDGTLSASQGDVQLQGPADIINHRGHITAQRQLSIDADRLDNHAGTLGGENIDLTLSDHLDNTDGLVEAANSLHLNAHSTLNSHGQLRALGSSGESTFNLSALFSNDQGQVDIGNARFSLNSTSLSNQQGTVQHIGTQGFNLSLADVGSAGGSFITHGALTLAVDQWLNTSMLQAQRLDLSVGHFTQTSSGQLLAVEDINASGEHWHNDGRIEAGGALHLNLQGHYRGQGALLSQGDLRLQAASGELQQGAQLRAGGDAELQLSGELSNAGQLSAAGPLALTAGALSNFGTLGSARSLHLAASSVLNDGGLLFSGEQMQLHTNQLSNRQGNIFSLATLDIAKDDTLAQMDLLDNLSGSIESSGDMQLRAAQLNNRKQRFSQGRALVWGNIAVKCGDCSGDHHNVDYVATEHFETRVSEDSPAARIHSGGKLSLQAGEIANRYSSISAVGDIDISAQHLENTGAASGNIERVRVFNTGRVTDGTDWRFRAAYIDPYNARPAPKELSSAFSGLGLTQDIETLTPTGLQAPALIQAGGAISIQASQSSSNSVLIDRQAPLAGNPQSLDSRAALTQPPLVVQLNPQRQADLQQQAINPLSLPDFALPDGDNGLFHINSDPGHPYLVETNPLFASLHGFLNSDYLLDQIGYHSDQTRRRLGDGLYEQRLIEQAIIARTGQRFLAGMTSDEAQFKQLMDNAIASKTALNLAPGIALSAEQVAALTHDIVWMQEQEVNGQKVLVPVLYLAQAKDRLAPSGALIAGRDINLISGSQLHNSGTLRAQRELQLSAGNVQNTGLIQADQRLNLLAADSLHNSHGGLITARQVSATTLTGDIRNERSISQQTRSGNHFSQTTSVVDSAAGIEASETLSLSAGRDILNTGGHINAGGNADLQAGRDLQISAAQAENGRMRQDKRHFWSNSSTTQYGSDVHIGGDLRALAGQDLTISASTLKSGGNTTLAATQNVAITSAANTSSQEFRYNGSHKKIHQQDSSVRQQAAQIDAGGNLDIGAGENLLLSASQLKAGQEAYLYAGNQLALLSAENSDYSLYDTQKKGSSGNKKAQRDEVTHVTNIGSAVVSGGNTTLVAEQDVLVKGSEISTDKGNIHLVAGQDVQIIHATDTTSENHHKSSSKRSVGGLASSKVKDQLSETRSDAVGSVISGDEVVLQAGRDATITGSALVSSNDLRVQAGRDLTINAAENTFSRIEFHKSKQRDLRGVAIADKSGFDDITGKHHLSISSQKHTGSAQETTLTGSTVGSSAGNTSLTAGRELKVVASDLVSTRNMALTGADVTIAAGKETAIQRSNDSAKSLAVGRVIGGQVVDTYNSIHDNVRAAQNSSDNRLKAVKAAQAALSAYNAYQTGSSAATNIADGKPANSSGSLIKIGTELSSNRSHSSSEYSSQTVKQASLASGESLAILATANDASSAGDIHIIGSSLKAGETLLQAKHAITLESAQNTTAWDNHSRSNRTSIGVSFNIGQQNGFTLDLGAQTAKGMGSGHELTQVNSTLNTGSLVLRSGQDTTLAGAQVHAETIHADIGGNLNIASRQDDVSSKNEQKSAGVGGSICVPPFCYGATVSASANIAASKNRSAYQAVIEQSGLYAGAGGYDINVGQATQLQGAVIASAATADKNHLSTDRLIFSDIKNHSKSQSQSATLSASYSAGESGIGGGLPLMLKDSEHSYTRSAISAGNISVRNAAGINDLLGLSRDTSNANPLLERPDETALQERMDLIQSTVALGQGFVATMDATKRKQAEAATKQAEQTGTPEDIQAALAAQSTAERWSVGGDKRLLADIATGLLAAGFGGAGGNTGVGILAHTTAADTYNIIGDYADQKHKVAIAKGDSTTAAAWAEGGAARVLLHSLAGAAQGLAGGNAQGSALGAGASAAIMPTIGDALKKSGLSHGDQDALATLIATGIGLTAADSGDLNGQIAAGASAAGVEKYNRQLHSTEAKLLEELSRRDPARSRAWDAAACALAKCSAGVPPGDPNYKYLVALEAEGALHPELQASLMASGLFTYSLDEEVRDAVLRHGEELYYVGAWGSVIGGGSGALVSGIVGAGSCTVTLGLGCVAGAAGVAGGVAEYSDGLDSLNSGYVSTEGQTVINSFRPQTHPGDVSPLASAGHFVVSAAAELVLDRVGGKAIEHVVKAVDGKLHVPKTGSAADDTGTTGDGNVTKSAGVPNKIVRPTIGTKIDRQVRLVETDKLQPGTVETFRNGEYVTVETTESVSLYRKFGGSSIDHAKLDGGYATTIPDASRQQSAVFPSWSSSRFEAEIVVPEGTKLNLGIVGQQPPSTLTPKYRGGADQVILPRNWSNDWVKSVRDGKTGIVYTYDEFKAAFPNQVTKGNR